MNAGLLALAVAAAFLPEVLPALLGGTRSAWFYVLSGMEAGALWFAVGSLLAVSQMPRHAMTAARCVCAWGAFESVQRPMCRLAFAMDRPPTLPEGKNLCDVATGLPMSWVSVVAALFLAALVQEFERVSAR